MKHRFIIPAFVAATALSGAAFAQDGEYTEDSVGQPGQAGQQGQSELGQDQAYDSGQHQLQQDFSQVDKDQDGVLSTQEARDALPEAIVIVDTNNDGMLNRDEAQQALPEVGFTGEPANQNEAIGEEDYLLIIQEVERQGMGSGQGQGLDQGQQSGSEFEG